MFLLNSTTHFNIYYMDIKRFDQINEDPDYRSVDTGLLGLSSGGHRRIPAMTNRRTQYFYDYYTGQRIRGKSKYELNSEMFKMAQRDDEMGMLAQFILQVERESMAYDYVDREEDRTQKIPEPIMKTAADEVEEIIESVIKFKDFI